MISFSRRALAVYAAERLMAKDSSKKVGRQLAAALLASKKHKEAELLVDDIAMELERRGILAQVAVTSARRLSPALKSRIQAYVKQTTGAKNVSLVEKIDEKVIGGVRIETAAHSWDKTIARMLADIKGGMNG